MAIHGLEKNDNDLIGFVTSSLFASAIDYEELSEWCCLVIGEHDVELLPRYIFDLISFQGPMTEIYEVIGFVPSWPRDDKDHYALLGIAAARGRARSTWAVTPAKAVEILQRRRGVEEMFRKTFPFIELKIPSGSVST